MPPLTRRAHSGISGLTDNTPQDEEAEDSQYVTLDAFKEMMHEIQSLKSLINDKNMNVALTSSEDTRSSGTVSDYCNNTNGMVKSIYDNIPQYNGDGDIQKLLDFTDKVDDYLAIADTTPKMEITLITTKLIGIASLLWRHHKCMYDVDSPHHIMDWKGLRQLLMQNKVTKEQERYVLSQLDMLKQRDSIQKYTTEFERYTMQLINLSLTIEMHYYLKGLKVEIRRLVESNELNLTDMNTRKNACLRQDHIMNPLPGSDKWMASKTNEENIALTASSVRGRYNGRGRYNTCGHIRNGRGSYYTSQRGGYMPVKSESNNSQEYNLWKPQDAYKGAPYRNDGTSIQCYACSETGHTARECPVIRDAIDRYRKGKSKAISTSSVRTMFTSTNDNRIKEDYPELRFLIDSGTTQHMTPHRELLQDFVATSKQITTAGNHVMDAIGEGNTIIMNDLQLTNVLLAPELQDSLLSIAAINDHEYDVTFNRNGRVTITDDNGTIAEGYHEGNLYYLQLHTKTPINVRGKSTSECKSDYACMTNVGLMSDYQLWHLRLGHLGTNSLLKMPTLVHGMDNVKLVPPESNVCEGCMYGKQSRKPFAESKTQRMLMELVHSDVIGPIRVPSINKARYILTFIEHRSRYPKCYFLENKEAQMVLKHFKEYKAWAENIMEKKIKILHTDGGREYINSPLDIYLKECGIEHQWTVPYTPQQNGIAECFNRTVIE